MTQRLEDSPNVEQCRRFFAEEIRAVAGLDSPALVDAFARVSRETYLGPPPWHFSSGTSLQPAYYRTTTDVRDLYHDVFVALKKDRALNNGQPSLIAKLIGALRLAAGSRVLHVGCGTGYYTALMAEVVGPAGQVTAFEVDPQLAARASLNLSCYPQVKVLNQDAASFHPGPCDAILVNAGITHLHPLWLSSLGAQGSLVAPWLVGRGPDAKDAFVIQIVRCGRQFSAHPVSLLTIYPCTSLRNPEFQALWNASFESFALLALRSVRTEPHPRSPGCLVHTPGFCLSSLPA